MLPHRRRRGSPALLPAAIASLLVPSLAPAVATAAPLRDPLDVQGLELSDGRIMDPPATPVWGRASGLDPRLTVPGLVRMRDEVGPIWVAWSPERGAASGIITTGIEAPGAVASPARAEALALLWLSRHLSVLAPGSTIADFTVVTNHLGSGIRTVGLLQLHHGVPVLGGQLSVRFKGDRLVYVSSQALPDVSASLPTGPGLDPSLAIDLARGFIARDYSSPSPSSSSALTATGPQGPFVLPIWTGTHWTYHAVVRVVVRSVEPLGEWDVYLDAHTGDPVAREQRMHSAVTVRFDVPQRHPGVPRIDVDAPLLDVIQNGMGATTNAAGQVTLTANPTTLQTSVEGPLVSIDDHAQGEASANFPVSDGDTVTWSMAGNEYVDAELSGFIHGSLVKEYVRALDPTLSWLDQNLDVNVNLNGSCNASSNGDAIFFLRANGSCQNTARLADVVYHEVGHSVHHQSVLEGVGAFESALSEGVSDYLAATIVDDSGMGRGFFHSNDPLRELNPVGTEWHWPEDTGEAHHEGQIIGGTLWDLRTALQAKLGGPAGVQHTDMIYYEATRRAVDIPSMYPEALVYDDDDGNLANGTPNGCEINEAFELHGLLDPTALGDGAVDLVPVPEGRQAVLSLALPVFPGCPVELSSAELRWRLRGDPGSLVTEAMTQQGGSWVATIPTQDTGVVVQYQVVLTYSNGQEAIFPNNPADEWYQTFFGAVVPIYCLDDMADLGQWSSGGPGNVWSVGPLQPSDVGVDPSEPYDADDVLIEQEDEYPNNGNSWVTGPMIDISGREDVRLHYRRWLTVEDGYYDQASLAVNGQTQWSNMDTPQATTHHIDREWRFHDVPLNDFLDDGEVELTFRLQSDQGLEFGGWTIDALCVVEVVEAVCGDGQVTGDEECDDGNLEDGDGCDATCVLEPEPGTTGGESSTGGEPPDDDTSDGGVVDETGGGVTGGLGTTTDVDEGSTGDEPEPGSTDPGGCGCTTGNEPGAPLHAAGLVLLVAGWRRRRRA
ncbi:DUF4215 domain-containing protein [Paraliomyxa miuraensis]|uniref:DUF4215 domain-containing protein n=1 Tax=Paraliomyxa miuraensis TaxID=376150 RepID=UPI00224CE3A1|nr:DUF4215 domain-containing protein [Paraliomyxa miuraensis]MCX4244123.1 DUF4215 domain-containing protein [Paraliomyxa miuraensis]